MVPMIEDEKPVFSLDVDDDPLPQQHRTILSRPSRTVGCERLLVVVAGDNRERVPNDSSLPLVQQ